MHSEVDLEASSHGQPSLFETYKNYFMAIRMLIDPDSRITHRDRYTFIHTYSCVLQALRLVKYTQLSLLIDAETMPEVNSPREARHRWNGHTTEKS
jgi:hypothetical protein